MDFNLVFAIFIIILPIIGVYLYFSQFSHFEKIAKLMSAKITRLNRRAVGASTGTFFSMEGIFSEMPFTVKIDFHGYMRQDTRKSFQVSVPTTCEGKIKVGKKETVEYFSNTFGGIMKKLEGMEKNQREMSKIGEDGFLRKYQVAADQGSNALLSKLSEDEDFRKVLSKYGIFQIENGVLFVMKRYRTRDLNKKNLEEVLFLLKTIKNLCEQSKINL